LRREAEGIVRRIGWVCVTAGFVMLAASMGWAEVKPARLFTANMVLQREMKVPVWGTAAPGEKVVVTMGEQRGEATADKDGKWMVKIGPMGAGGPFEMVIAGTNTITLKNVLVGEVWVCSGQSKMEWTLSNSLNGRDEAEKAN